MELKELARKNLLKKDFDRSEEILQHILARGRTCGLSLKKLEKIVWTMTLLEFNKNLSFKINKDIQEEVEILYYKNDCSKTHHYMKLTHCNNSYVKLIFEEKLKWKSRQGDTNE